MQSNVEVIYIVSTLWEKVVNIQVTSGEGSMIDERYIIEHWPKVLDKVKERKITVHAWLIDGQPEGIINLRK
jgi:hypothetical protein